jgi:hypothetical protein
MSIDDVIEEAIGQPFGWDSDDIRELFEDRSACTVVRFVCGLCANNRDIGWVRRIKFGGETMTISGRREVVGIYDTVLRRHIMASIAPEDPRNGRRRVPRVYIVEPIQANVTAWCPKHHHLKVTADEIDAAIAHYERPSRRGGLRPPAVVRVTEPQRGPRLNYCWDGEPDDWYDDVLVFEDE